MNRVVGPCETEGSQKPVLAHDELLEALRQWHKQSRYQSPESWVFASPQNNGRRPYLAQQIMRTSTGAELKIMQELLRHSTIRLTLDTYTRAVTTEKRNAQDAVVALLFPQKTQERSDAA